MSNVQPPKVFEGSLEIPKTTLPTQVEYPWKAAIRTAIQAALPTLAILLALLGYVQEFVETIAPGSSVIAWIVGATAVVAAASALVTKIMTNPLVNSWLTSIGLGAEPKTLTEKSEEQGAG